jgi:glycosyltransferase involved in cell wall biosynthesis
MPTRPLSAWTVPPPAARPESGRNVPKIVITMPAYRAEQTLAKTVADIPRNIADLLILVDDASPDNTASLARELGIDVDVHPVNRYRPPGPPE